MTSTGSKRDERLRGKPRNSGKIHTGGSPSEDEDDDGECNENVDDFSHGQLVSAGLSSESGLDDEMVVVTQTDSRRGLWHFVL